MTDLSDTDRAMLDFEARWWRLGGAKETAIMETFGTTATRYYMRLNVLIDTPEAEAYDPVLVHRLRRLRDEGRGPRRGGVPPGRVAHVTPSPRATGTNVLRAGAPQHSPWLRHEQSTHSREPAPLHRPRGPARGFAMRTHARAAAATTLTAVVALTLSACGGGSSDDASPAPDTTPESTAEPTTVESAVEEDLRDIEVTEDTDPALIRASLLQQWDDQSADDQQVICEGYGMIGSLAFSDVNEDGAIPESMVPVVVEQLVSIVEERCDLDNGPDRVVSEGRDKPVNLGVPVNVVSASWEGEILSDAEVSLGEANWSAAANIENYSDEEAVPEPGMVFVTVPVTVTLTSTDQATPVEPDYTFDLAYVAPDGRTFPSGSVFSKDSITRQPSLFPGATATGSVAFELPEDALGDGAVWMVSPWVSPSPVPTFIATH